MPSSALISPFVSLSPCDCSRHRHKTFSPLLTNVIPLFVVFNASFLSTQTSDVLELDHQSKVSDTPGVGCESSKLFSGRATMTASKKRRNWHGRSRTINHDQSSLERLEKSHFAQIGHQRGGAGAGHQGFVASDSHLNRVHHYNSSFDKGGVS